MSETFNIAILGAGGYAGTVLCNLLRSHPILHPRPLGRMPAPAPDASDLGPLADCDAVVLAVPSDVSARWRLPLMQSDAPRVLDLSDLHRRTPNVPYALRELAGAAPVDAPLVANPGCYPTATLLALAPLQRAGLIAPDGVGVVGSSGASGAGKSLREDLHFCQLESNVHPYNVGHHRHQPEIQHHLGAPVSLVTQLLPLSRGLTVTAFVRPAEGVRPEDLRDCLEAHYDGAPYVHVLDCPDARVGLKTTVGSHDARIGVGPTAHGGLVPVVASIDNLMRGAASQALVALNDMFGLDPWLGLDPPRDPHTHPGGPAASMFAHAQH